MTDTGKRSSRRITLKDIARRLDLSHTTISRALNHTSDPLISETTRRRVRQVAEEMGYRPNQAARTLATGRTGLVSLWLWSESVQSTYHSIVARQMHRESQRHRYQLVVDPVERQAVQDGAIPRFNPWHVDGVIAHEAGPLLEAQISREGRLLVPIVATGSFNVFPGVDHVLLDLSEGADEALSHLFALGRRKIVYVRDDLARRPGDARYDCYSERMQAEGLAAQYLQMPSDRAGVRVRIREFVQENGVPEAFYCHNDDLAIATYRAMCDLGIRVPDDVAIVGCDGIEDTEYLEVPITTIVLPLAEMCALALDFLDRRIEDPTLPIQEARLTARLEIRGSTDPDAAKVETT